MNSSVLESHLPFITDDLGGLTNDKVLRGLLHYYGGGRFNNGLLVRLIHFPSKYSNVSLLIDGVPVGFSRNEGDMVTLRLTRNTPQFRQAEQVRFFSQ